MSSDEPMPMDTDVERPSLEKQKSQIKAINSDWYEKGSVWFLVEWNWWVTWKNYVGYDMRDDEERIDQYIQPGAIDNAGLVEEDGRLKEALMQTTHYELVPEESWKLLKEWYGGAPEIERGMIEVGENKDNVVEVYPLSLSLAKNSKKHPLNISKAATVADLCDVVAEMIGFESDKTELRYNNGDGRWRLMNNRTAVLDDVGIIDGAQLYAMQQRTPSSHIGTTGAGTRITQLGSRYEEPKPKNQNTLGSNGTHGVVGLRNLGNTCFMNSALQCLSNTGGLTDYFVSKKYLEEINRTNLLGLKGKLADEYGGLINEMWSGQYSCISPSSFKWAISRFATQFSGYRQHDSQELIAFLIDGLHEDLNRVIDKPYIETPDQDEAAADERLAEDAWERHLQRNRSVMVDLFHGQLKSTVTCPECGFLSRTFDPVMYLSVPLPVSNEVFLDIIYVPLDYNQPRKIYRLEVSERSKVSSIIEQFCGMVEGTTISPEEIILSEVSRGNITRTLDPRGTMYSIPKLLFAFQAEPIEDDGQLLSVQVVHRAKREMAYSKYSTTSSYNIFGEPFVVSLPLPEDLEVTKKSVYNAVIDKVNKFVGPEFDVGENEPAFEMHIGTSSYDSRAVSLDESEELIKLSKHQPKVVVLVNWSDKEYYDDTFTAIETIKEEADEGPSSGISLQDCIELFTREEKLGKGDEWYCPKCKEFHQASKKFSLWKTPQYLIIHFKRFSQGRSAYSSTSKIDINIEYPVEGLNLSSFIENEEFLAQVEPLYDLYAVSIHSGGLGGGHYTALGKNPIDNQWYSFNDSSTSPVNLNRVQTSGAYLLFYKLRGTHSNLPETIKNTNE